MEFVAGFLIWLGLGLLAAVVGRAVYRAPDTTAALTFAFGVFGAFIGGMLGMSPYVYVGPEPLQFGGLLGAGLGAFFFVFLYNYIGRNFV